MTFFAILLVLASVFGWLNERVLRLPPAIGVMVGSLAVSVCILTLDRAFPGMNLSGITQAALGTSRLPQTLLDGALSLLLFAGALHVRLDHLWSRKLTVLLLATLGVLLATLLFGFGIEVLLGAVGRPVPLLWCLVLGAILAPTDPVAVAELLKRVGLPPVLEAVVAGESLFNDGVGVVVFNALVAVAAAGAGLHAGPLALSFARVVAGGTAIGFVTGWIAYLAIRGVDEYRLEMTITLALATATYVLANRLGTSGPIAVVVAGLLIGNHATAHAMSEATRAQITNFWGLIDELLNALLFLLIGFELLAVQMDGRALLAAMAALPLALAVRFVSVVVPTWWLHWHNAQRWPATIVLTWGGLRGGISVALALSLPDVPWRGPILVVCYAVVVFTIIGQGLTMGRVIGWVYRK